MDNAARYPLHTLRGRTKDSPDKDVTIHVSPMALPGQGVIREARTNHLICLACDAVIAVEPEVWAQAANAAHAEGFRGCPPPPDSILPGMLSTGERAYLYALFQVELYPDSTSMRSAVDDAYKKGFGPAYLHGFVDGGHLTSPGREMARLLAAPAVDASRLRHDLAHAPPPVKAKMPVESVP